MKGINQIQREMIGWQNRNFPGRPTWQPLVGLVEEVGELGLAIKQRDEKEIVDAIGDIMIYMTDLCNGMGVDLDQEWGDATSFRFIWRNEDQIQGVQSLVRYHQEIVIHTGRLCHAFLKDSQGIRMHENHRKAARVAMTRIMHYLDDMTMDLEEKSSVEGITDHVWDKVSKRDWQKNRDTAHLEQKERGHPESVVESLHGLSGEIVGIDEAAEVPQDKIDAIIKGWKETEENK